MKCYPVLLFVVVAFFACVGCGRHDQPVQDDSSAASSTQTATLDEGTNQLSEDEQKRRQELAEAMAYAEKLDEQKMQHPELFTNPPPSEWPFPNYPAGPGNPLPPNVNFYRINDHYPAYLLCEYDVDQSNYSQTNEPKWFEAALEQIRQSGPKKFPPVKWVAVILINRAGWNGVSTYEQAHKVGAIYKASAVFSPSCDLSQLVAQADMDRHPLKYDQSQPTPGDQDRWLIVEQHAATNSASMGPK